MMLGRGEGRLWCVKVLVRSIIGIFSCYEIFPKLAQMWFVKKECILGDWSVMARGLHGTHLFPLSPLFIRRNCQIIFYLTFALLKPNVS